MPRVLTFVEAVREATAQIMAADKNVILIGEGVPDPKCVFGTTKDLQKEFPDRVFDMPISENALTGACVGMAVTGLRPIIVHQRIDFMLYAMDQIVNNAAKWFSMFGGNAGTCPMVIRCIVGRGWGQGNQHSQNLAGLFATIPGLKVFVPSNAKDAKGMLISASKQEGPVVFVEHRWLHNTTSEVPEEMYETFVDPELGVGDYRLRSNTYKSCAKVISNMYDRRSPRITVVAWGHMVLEAIKAGKILAESAIEIEILDMRSMRPLDIKTVKKSVLSTKRLLVLDDSWRFNGIAGEVIAQIAEDHEIDLDYSPKRVTLPDGYAPSSPHSAPDYYPRTAVIVEEMLRMLFLGDKEEELINKARAYDQERPHDVPDQNFKGPF